MKNLTEILVDPPLLERDMVYRYVGENGLENHGFGIPVKLSATPGSIRTAPGEFGEQTVKILEEIGYSTAQIDSFVAKGIV